MLGFYWSIINPLVLMVVYTVVFSVIFRSPAASQSGNWWDYSYLLFSGLLPWLGTQEAISRSTTVFVEQANILKKTTTSPLILVLSINLSTLLTQCVSFSIFLTAIIILGVKISSSWMLIPVAFILQYLFLIGMGLILSSANALFRDTQHFVSIILGIFFFLSPVIYPSTLVPEKFRMLYYLNPMAVYIDIYRGIFSLEGATSSLLWLVGAILSFLALGAGLWLFNKIRRELPDYL